MSLINQALKKAQNDRSAKSSEPAKPAVSPVSTPSSPPPIQGKPHSGISPALIIGLVIGLFVVVAGLLILVILLILRPDEPEIQYAAPTTSPISEPIEPQQAPPNQLAPATQPVANTVTAAEQEIAEQLRLAREASEAKAKEEAEAKEKARLEAEALAAEKARLEEEARLEALAAEKAAEEAAKITHNTEIVKWLSNATVSGVRLSPSGNKVLINGKAYGVGEEAHFGLGIKVMVIEEDRVLFIDKNGKRYVKRI